MEKYQAMLLYCLAGLVIKNTGETIESFLSDADKWADGIVIQPKPKAPPTATRDANLEADIEEIYKAYPTRCERRGQSTGKCSKDKDRIRILLTKKHKTKDDILAAISQAVSEGAYLKNFSTFLNNLPEVISETDNKEPEIWQ